MAVRLIGVGVILGMLLAVAPQTLGQSGRGSGGTQADINAAARRDFDKADRALNDAYQRLYSRLEPEARAKLKTAELAWLRFRDAEGEFRASEFKGGTIQLAARLGYLEELTRRRTQELKNAYKQFVVD
jgi:uncharacterized protein YecT (DUF1311 family)